MEDAIKDWICTSANRLWLDNILKAKRTEVLENVMLLFSTDRKAEALQLLCQECDCIDPIAVMRLLFEDELLQGVTVEDCLKLDDCLRQRGLVPLLHYKTFRMLLKHSENRLAFDLITEFVHKCSLWEDMLYRPEGQKPLVFLLMNHSVEWILQLAQNVNSKDFFTQEYDGKEVLPSLLEENQKFAREVADLDLLPVNGDLIHLFDRTYRRWLHKPEGKNRLIYLVLKLARENPLELPRHI